MKEERTVWVDRKPYPVVLSDEREALLAAQAAGRAVVEIWDGSCSGGRDSSGGCSGGRDGSGGCSGGRDSSGGCSGGRDGSAGSGGGRDSSAGSGDDWDGGGNAAADGGGDTWYLAERSAADDARFLERVVRRQLGKPWTIAETGRLLIREFTVSDARHVPEEESGGAADRIFAEPQRLAEYIRCQYGFYEYGIWALTDRKTGTLLGKAGVSPGDPGIAKDSFGESGTLPGASVSLPKHILDEAMCFELGYHVFAPYRGQGYASEACRAILGYLDQEYSDTVRLVYARTEAANRASVRVLESCGFRRAGFISAGLTPVGFRHAGFGHAGFTPADGGDVLLYIRF